MNQPSDFIMMPIPAKAYSAVCALLGGAIIVGNPAFGQPEKLGRLEKPDVPQEVERSGLAQTAERSAPSDNSANGDQFSISTTATTDASLSDAEIDAHGHPWSADMHASTKGKTKDGLWRMKVGVSRPDPLPGFPVGEEAIGTSLATDTSSATSADATEVESAPAATDEDEFAAFRAAADASNAADEAAAASVPARTFSDADLGALCNQAAVKLGDPSPVKEIIAKYVPEGQVAHSRNIPEDQREEFAAEIEAKAGVQFAG